MKTKVLYDNKTIISRIKELAAEISLSYNDGKQILCVCVLKGAFMFFSELVKHIEGDVIVDFVTLSSYKAAETTGKVRLIGDIRESVEDRHVLIVEDIVDSGFTVDFLKNLFALKNALSVEIVCLLDKPSGRKVPVQADYKAFSLESSAFVVGFGLDYDQHYRNYDCIMEVDLGS